MRATVFHAPGDLRVEDVPDPTVQEPTDAVVRVTHAAVCGSDLWFYRGIQKYREGFRCGHELLGVVEDTGSEVQTLARGDLVVAPFLISDGTCEFCHAGLHSSCVNGGVWAMKNDGGQGEAVRAPFADGTLVKLPDSVEGDKQLLERILPLTDVMSTGHHGVVSAGARAGGTVAVVGDGAVGLSAVIAAKRIGAERILALGHHEDRLEIASRLGATDIVAGEDDEAIAGRVSELTEGGAESVVECVGTGPSMNLAIAAARPGGTVGYVGVPHNDGTIDRWRMFGQNIAVRGGMAPVRAYLPELLDDVIAGKLDPSPVLDMTVDLDGVPDGYAAMDERRSIKAMVRL